MKQACRVLETAGGLTTGTPYSLGSPAVVELPRSNGSRHVHFTLYTYREKKKTQNRRRFTAAVSLVSNSRMPQVGR